MEAKGVVCRDTLKLSELSRLPSIHNGASAITPVRYRQEMLATYGKVLHIPRTECSECLV